MKISRTRHAAGFLAACFLVLTASCSIFLFFSARERILHPAAQGVSAAEEDMARSAWRNGAALSETVPQADASALEESLHARSAILVDAATGAVLFRKNADERIPPASMTKLVAMYTAIRAAANGEITFDDVVDLPPESWAINIPAGSSLMFLAQGQRVTVRELLSGMAIVSGNDAAIALACHVSGSVDAFVARMNAEMERLGLEKTRFVEPSGLSENNLTTAGEFVSFAETYIREYPEALKAFHSRPSLAYPQSWNIPERSRETPVFQSATNRLLGQLEGCDGLKTGFINESGYNLALTAERNGTRFLSVTMGGPGRGSAEGNRLRSEDGTALIEWAFSNYETVKPDRIVPRPVAVFGGKTRAVRAIPATGEAFTVKRESGSNGDTRMTHETVETLSPWLAAPVSAGDVIGSVDYLLDGKTVHSVPLVADRNSERAGIVARATDGMALLFAPLVN